MQATQQESTKTVGAAAGPWTRGSVVRWSISDASQRWATPLNLHLSVRIAQRLRRQLASPVLTRQSCHRWEVWCTGAPP